MYIIGTSGHIDHGKTSLIATLTGTDCDRLPEEKAREMTIDIGFAGFESADFGTVGVIDVPGHERFIRNMVTGAWGIDLALLVVAVDDGWMPQTEDHFRVLRLLSIPRLIIVLNKIDIADAESASLVEEEIREKLRSTEFKDADIIRVSAKTGTGITELKVAIEENLHKLPKAINAEKPYLIIDRVFASKGHGTIVTGTQKNGFFKENETVCIIPTFTEARIKRVESHYSRIEEGSAAQRTALNLAGIAANDLHRGHIVFKTNFFIESESIIARLRFFVSSKPKNNTVIEVLIGTTRFLAKMILLENSGNSEITARLVFDKPCFCYAAEPFIITAPGGYNITGGGHVILPGYMSKDKKQLKEHLNLTTETSIESILFFIITIKRFIKRSEIESMFAEGNIRLNEIINRFIIDGSLASTGDYIMPSTFYKSAVEKIKHAIKENSGLNIKEISDINSLPFELTQFIMNNLNDSGLANEKDGRYFANSTDETIVLSEKQKQVLEQILSLADDGIELDKTSDINLKNELKKLLKLKYVISLDGNILYHCDIYKALSEKVLSITQNDITIADARNVSGLSRKYIIPLLNKMESDGLIKRFGDIRVKV